MRLSKAGIIRVAKLLRAWLDDMYLNDACSATFHHVEVKRLRAWMRSQFALARN